MNMSHKSLRQYALSVVAESDPLRKAHLARHTSRSWQTDSLPVIAHEGPCQYQKRPGRPDKPILLSPRDMPKRRTGSKKGLLALLHSLVHIELNAVDLSFDLIARFAHLPLPRSFFDDAVKVGLEEAEHFLMLDKFLTKRGASYGDFPAHGGFWDAALETAHDILARLAIVQLVLEARGLDITPGMISKLESAGETEFVACLEIIYRDEITHVAFGAKWFRFFCQQQQLKPELHFQSLVKKYFKGSLKGPFNEKARRKAGLTPEFYSLLANS